MAGTLGTIRGQVALDVRQAVAGYVALRTANAATVFALSRSSAAFLGAGKAMGAGGLLIAAGFAVAIKSAAEFERKLDFFGAVSNATTAQMEQVRAKAIQLGQDTIFSAGQIADSFVELGKAGVSANDIIGGVGQAVAMLGAAGDIPLTQAAMIMTAAVQTFGLKASDAVHVTDLLAGAANASIVEISDLGTSLKYVGGIAAAISIPIGDTITAISLLGKAGIRGSTAGTSLRQILVSLSGGSKRATAELKDLGIITKSGANLFFDAAGKAKPLAEIFQILQDHTKGLTEAQRLAAFKIIFNNRALAAAAILTRDGAKGFQQMNAEISKTTAADVAHKRLDNLSGDIEILRGNLETLFIQTGGPMQEFLRGIVQGVTGIVAAFANLDRGTQVTILKIAAGFGAALLAMGAIATVIGTVLKFAESLKLLWIAAKFLWPVVTALGGAFRALGLAMFANPIGLIVLAVIALIAAFVILYKRSETFRNFINAQARDFVTGWNQIVAFFKGIPGFFSNVWNTIRNAWTTGWNAVVTFFTVTIPTWFNNMVNTITSTLSGWWGAFTGFWAALPGQILAFVQQLVDGVVNFFMQLPYRVGFAIGFLIGTAVRLFLTLANQVYTISVSIVNGVVNFFAALPGRISALISFMVNTTISFFVSLYNRVISVSTSIVNGVTNFFAQLPSRVASFVSSMVSRGVALFNEFNSRARALASAVLNGVVSFLAQLPGRVASFISNMYNQAVTRFNNLVNAARQMGSNIISAVSSTLSSLPGMISGIVGRAIDAFKSMVGAAFNAAKSFAGGLWDGFKKGLGINSPSFIEKQMVQITKVTAEETNRLRSQVKAVQNLGSRLTNIPTLQPSEIDAAFTASTVRQLGEQYKRLNALKSDFQSASSDVTASINSQAIVALSGTSLQVPPGQAISEVRLPQDQLDALGKRSVNVDFTAINPIAEPTSETAANEMTRLATLEVFS